MSKPWYQYPLRIAALQCNFENGQTLEVADRWARIGFNTEQLFHPMADSYSALFDRRRHGDLLKAYLERAQRNRLRIILYMNVHILGPALADRKDEWAQQAAGGTAPLLYGTYPAVCVNSPWRDYYFQALRDLAGYAIDGIFLDGPIVISGGCHCRHCQARYHQESGQALPADAADFGHRSLTRFVRDSYRLLKRLKPHGVHYQNCDIPTAILHGMLPYNDILGTEGGFMFYNEPKKHALFRPDRTAKLLEAIAPEKPRVIFMAADQKSWSWVMHTPAETRLCIAGSVANGANIWYGLHGSTRLLETPGGRAGREMIGFLARQAEVFDQTVSAARVAVLYSFNTAQHYRTRVEESDLYAKKQGALAAARGNFSDAFQGICDLLFRSAIPFDIVTDLNLTAAHLKRYDCLLLSTCACLSPKTLSQLRAWVRRGGTLISTFDTSLFDAAGRMQKDFGLADVFGAHFDREFLRLENFNYFRKTADHPLWRDLDLPLFPAPTAGIGVCPAPTAEVLARFLKPLAGRYVPLTEPDKPAIVLNRFGKGRSLYLAGTFGEMAFGYAPPEYRRLLGNALALFAKQPVVLEGALGNVELVVRRQPLHKNRLIIHLVNYAGLPPRPFEKVYPQRGLRLRLAPPPRGRRLVRALAAGCACRTRAESQGLIIDLPPLKEYEVIVVE